MADTRTEQAKALREKLVKFTPFREKVLDLDVPQGDGKVEVLKVLLRQPTVAQRDRILAEAQGGNVSGGKVDGTGLSRGQALAAILCTLDPETRAPLFTETDMEMLIEQPSGGWLDVLAREAMGLMNGAQQNASKSDPG